MDALLEGSPSKPERQDAWANGYHSIQGIACRSCREAAGFAAVAALPARQQLPPDQFVRELVLWERIGGPDADTGFLAGVDLVPTLLRLGALGALGPELEVGDQWRDARRPASRTVRAWRIGESHHRYAINWDADKPATAVLDREGRFSYGEEPIAGHVIEGAVELVRRGRLHRRIWYREFDEVTTLRNLLGFLLSRLRDPLSAQSWQR